MNLSFEANKIQLSCIISETISDMDSELDALEAKLSKARQIKQGMIQELLTGKTRLV
jgi:type I restriction enzyme S subunit